MVVAKTDSSIGRLCILFAALSLKMNTLSSSTTMTPTRPERHHFDLSITQIRLLQSQGVLRPAPKNRTVIPDEERPRGTCQGYWAGQRKGMNPGQMVGYSLDDAATVEAAIKTGKFDGVAFYVTDFGHRLSWLCSPLDSVVFEDGHTLTTLQKADRPLFDKMMREPVNISMVTHPDEEYLKAFADEEYGLLNTTQTNHSTGELVKATTRSSNRQQSEARVKNILETYFPSTAEASGAHSADDCSLRQRTWGGTGCVQREDRRSEQCPRGGKNAVHF